MSAAAGQQTEWIPQLCISEAHERAIYSVSVMPNDQVIATGSGDETIKLWMQQEETWACQEIISVGTEVNCVRWDKQGSRLAAATDEGSVIIWQINV